MMVSPWVKGLDNGAKNSTFGCMVRRKFIKIEIRMGWENRKGEYTLSMVLVNIRAS